MSVGLFCLHLIAVFEHLRLDKIPDYYVLQRYTKDPVTEPDFYRKDCLRQEENGNTIHYRRSILYNEAIKLVSKGCSSDHMFNAALAAFKKANLHLDTAAAMDPNSEPNRSSHEDGTARSSQYAHKNVSSGLRNAAMGATNNAADETSHGDDRFTGWDDVPYEEDTATTAPYAHILPPLKSNTKGSGNSSKSAKGGAEGKTYKTKKTAPKRPEPELDEYGNPKGQRLCSGCNTIAGHNRRTCERRKLEKQLIEEQQKLHGTDSNPHSLKVSVKKVLAKKYFKKKDEEELIDTEEDEESEKETEDDEDESSGNEADENNTHTQESEQSGGEEMNQDDDDAQKKTAHTATLEAEGQRRCSICGEKKKHNARSCPMKLEILQQKLLARQVDGDDKEERKGKRVCSNCGKIRGHNARTCKRLQMEEELRRALEAREKAAATKTK